MKLFSFNVNGIRAIEKKGFIDWVNEVQPDILCLQEIKAMEDQLSDELKNIPGYKVIIHSAERKGYSGTAIYYKEEPIKIWTGLPNPKFNTEGRTIAMEYEDFILMNIYFPNGQKDDERLAFKMEFYDEFLNYSNELISQGKNLIVTGDYNVAHNEIDLKNPKANEKRSGFLPIERRWMDIYIENGSIDTFRYFNPDKVKYSWWSYRFNARKNNAGWRIDYFFVNNAFIDRVINTEIHNDVIGSDHCPISLEIK